MVTARNAMDIDKYEGPLTKRFGDHGVEYGKLSGKPETPKTRWAVGAEPHRASFRLDGVGTRPFQPDVQRNLEVRSPKFYSRSHRPGELSKH